MRIPGLGRINKKLSTYLGNERKSSFEKFINSAEFKADLNKTLIAKSRVNLEIVTFTNSIGFPDLILSILSFINSTGLPSKWTIYADDNFTAEQRNVLNAFEFIVYQKWYANISAVDREKYNSRWQFRKYLCLSTHMINTTTVFIDSDVLFYNQFNKYKEFVKESNWYLPEPIEAFSIDQEITKREDYKLNMYIINSGIMILNKMPPWNLGKQYLAECLTKNSITHFTEQSAVNIVYANDSHARILEPRVFHVSTSDHFKFGFFKTNELAMRHYVGLVRHKMWQAGWKQFI